jgi:xanthine dehydrogenase accessory factor
MKNSVFDALQSARAEKRAAVLATELGSGHQLLLDEAGKALAGDLPPAASLVAAAQASLAADQSRKTEDGRHFLQVFGSPWRMAVIGAVHIAQALVPMAQLLGSEVTVVDPRRAWASAARFPGVTLTHDWPDDALAAFQPDRRTAVVALTHDPKLDDPALALALASPAFYIGALGSKRTHEKRRERLAENGVSAEAFARIDGPIGLSIGAKSPAEIALAILGKITQVRRQPRAEGP